MLSILQSTKKYDAWLREQLLSQCQKPDREGLKTKHRKMAGKNGPFPFYRGTFYHWVQSWVDEKSRDVPMVLSVGDPHLENFGTWRDAEGRLVWGINDFDEACPLPFTADLIRLAAGAPLAQEDTVGLYLKFDQICRQIRRGYRDTLKAGRAAARPIVLSEENGWLGEIATRQLHARESFWEDLVPTTRAKRPDIDPELQAAVHRIAPPGSEFPTWLPRVAGMGSLGRPRVLALGTWQGSILAREAKAVVPSAYYCMADAEAPGSHLDKLLRAAVRCPDPYFRRAGHWIVRRLAPDCMKLTPADIPPSRQEEFCYAMGREIAHVHFATPAAVPRILRCLDNLPPTWLRDAAAEAAATAREEWKLWRRHYKSQS